MGTIAELSQWESEIYLIEVDDPVSGGLEGVANMQPIQLANRTLYLKGELDIANLAIVGLQGSFNQLSSDLQDADIDIASIRADINSIRYNYGLQGIEGEQFFLAIAF